VVLHRSHFHSYSSTVTVCDLFHRVNVEAACVQTTHVDLHSEKHKFKIGMYSVLARLNRGGLAVYMGLNQPFLLSPSYKLNCRYQVSLCLFTDEAKEGECIQPLKPCLNPYISFYSCCFVRIGEQITHYSS
jgi:hypothetical protein